MPPAVPSPSLTTLAALLIMAGEAVLSSFNERQLRARGAIEPEGDVIGVDALGLSRRVRRDGDRGRARLDPRRRTSCSAASRSSASPRR